VGCRSQQQYDSHFAGGPLTFAEGVEINNNTPLTAGSPLPIDHFFRFALHPNLDFELTGLAPSGASTNCALAVLNGQTCSLLVNGVESPLVLQANGVGGTTASITFFGLASDTGSIGPGSSNWAGSFSPTVANLTPLQIATLLCPNYVAQGDACTAADVAAGHQVNFLSTSGSFTTSLASGVPEPGTVSMIMIGFALLTISQVRKRARKA
jgi:hypothetical protein